MAASFGPDKLVLPTHSSNPTGVATGEMYFNTDNNQLMINSSNGWQQVNTQPPSVTNISGTINENTSSTITITGENFAPGSIVSILGNAVGGVPRQLTTTFVNSTTLTANTDAATTNYVAGEAFDVKVINSTGLSGSLAGAGFIDTDPVWVTAAGSIGTVYNGVSSTVSVSASDPDGDVISYSFSGVPTGMSASGGSITGIPSGYASAYSGFPFNAADSTTIPITATATANGQSISRSFSVTAIDPYNPLNIIENWYASADILAGSTGTFPTLFFDDECDGNGLVHGMESNGEADNWYIFHFTVPIRVNQVRVKGRNHLDRYLGNWYFKYNTSAVTAFSGGGWNVAVSATGYEPGTCTMGGWRSSSYTGYSKYWLFSMYGNVRGAYQSHAGMEIDYTIQV